MRQWYSGSLEMRNFARNKHSRMLTFEVTAFLRDIQVRFLVWAFVNMTEKETTQIRIQIATEKDLKKISDLFIVESAKKPYYEFWNKKTALKKIKELFEKGLIYAIITEKEIIGFVSVLNVLGTRGKTAHIEELWIKAKYQKMGIGRKLINFLEKTYKERGFKSFSLISDKKSKAFKFYKKMKYHPDFDYIFMAKKLS